MRKLSMAVVALAVSLVPVASRAEMALGLRLGYAPSMGDVASGGEMEMSGQVPVQADILFKVNPNLEIGPYASYGFASLKSKYCGSGVTCSASDVRLGVQAIYTAPQPGMQMTPWAGVGIGYEWASEKQEAYGASVEASYSGFEFLNLQAGGDWKVNEQLSMGPYLMLSIAQYSSATLTANGTSYFDGSIPEKAGHQWFHFGIRGRFDVR